MPSKTAFGMFSKLERTQAYTDTKRKPGHIHRMRRRYLKAFTILSILLASTLASPSSHGETEVLVSLNKHVFFIGESVIISGTVHSPNNSIPVIVQVWNPEMELCVSRQVNVTDDGSFIVGPITLSGNICSVAGTYEVTASYGSQTVNSTFELQAPTAATQDAGKGLQKLLYILSKAKQKIYYKIGDLQARGFDIPAELMQVYEEALVEAQETKDGISNDDAFVKEHAMNAMLLYREVFAGLMHLEESKTSETDELKIEEKISELRHVIVRTINFKNRLANIAATSNVDVNFADFNNTIQKAATLVEEGKIEETEIAVGEAHQILIDIKKSLMKQAREQRELKAREFVLRTVARVDEMIQNAKEIGLPQDVIDSLEQARAKLLEAKSTNEIFSAAMEIKKEAIIGEIEVLDAVVADLKSDVGNNKEVQEHINKAVEDLDDAKDLVREDHLYEANIKINDAKENIKKAKQIIDGNKGESPDSSE
ncbi:MAG: Ig-like domain-containing protein [Nitrososphaerales archaeon]